MTDPQPADFFASRKKKKKFGFNASTESAELQQKEIVHDVVKTISCAALKHALQDGLSCPRRRAALTILRDFAFAFGTTSNDHWPCELDAIGSLTEFIYSIRGNEMEVVPKRPAMIGFWKELGVLWSTQPESASGRSTYHWDLDRINEVLSFLTFKSPETSAEVDHKLEEAVEDLALDDDDRPALFLAKIPAIVEAVVFRKDGASTSDIIQEAGMERLLNHHSPGHLLCSIPEIVRERNRYFLANKDGYKDPLLV